MKYIKILDSTRKDENVCEGCAFHDTHHGGCNIRSYDYIPPEGMNCYDKPTGIFIRLSSLNKNIHVL